MIKKGRKRRLDYIEVAQDYAARNLSAPAVAKLHGCSESSVRQIAAKVLHPSYDDPTAETLRRLVGVRQ